MCAGSGAESKDAAQVSHDDEPGISLHSLRRYWQVTPPPSPAVFYISLFSLSPSLLTSTCRQVLGQNFKYTVQELMEKIGMYISPEYHTTLNTLNVDILCLCMYINSLLMYMHKLLMYIHKHSLFFAAVFACVHQ